MQKKFHKRPDLNAVLFMIGIREKGFLPKSFEKEEKQDLMNLALCRVLSISGYFKITGRDKDGWPMFEQSKPLPKMDVSQQERFIKEHVIHYFYEENLLEA